MDNNSTRSGSILSNEDPVRSPSPSDGSEEYSSTLSEPVDAGPPVTIVAAPPATIITAHIRDRAPPVPQLHRQPRQFPLRPEVRDDVILPIAPVAYSPSHHVIHDSPENEKVESASSKEQYSYSALSKLATRRPIPEALDQSPKKVKSGRRWILFTKWVIIIALFSIK